MHNVVLHYACGEQQLEKVINIVCTHYYYYYYISMVFNNERTENYIISPSAMNYDIGGGVDILLCIFVLLLYQLKLFKHNNG